MVSFNYALTQQLLPGIDPETVISSKQFLTTAEMEKYFLVEVNDRMKGQSEQVIDKPMFHKFNHIIPYVKMTINVGEKIECGSLRSNQKGKNNALLDNKEADKEYVYPFEDDKCYAAYGTGKLYKEPLGNDSDPLIYAEEGGATSRGFVNSYQGKGHSKIVKMNMTNENFFRDFFKEEIIDRNFTKMQSTLSIIIQFVIYNPNLQLLQEKHFAIEYLEPGGIINFEHDTKLVNTKLYRSMGQNIQSILIMINGAIMFIISMIQIKADAYETGLVE